MRSVQILFSIVIVLVLSAIAAVLYGVAINGRMTTTVPVVTDFGSCAQAGYPVMESYPRQCASPDGRSFIEVIVESVNGDMSTSTASTTPDHSVPTNVQLQ